MQATISGMLLGPFAYAERWGEKTGIYLGLAIERASNTSLVIDSDSTIKPNGSKRTVPHRCNLALGRAPGSPDGCTPTPSGLDAGGRSATPPTERKPTRFTSAVIVSPERPAWDIHQIVEAIIEQLTALPGSRVKIRLEIDTEVPEGLERSKVRTLVENAADRDVWFRCCGR